MEKVVEVSVARSIASNQCISLFFILMLGMLWGLQGVSAAEDEEMATQSSYVAIEPALVTNYGGPGRLRYMSVEVSLRVSGVEAENSVSHHMPQIKDTLLNLFAVQTNETIETAQGKETLRQQSFEEVSSVLLEEEKETLLEDILFTSFVVYR
ncbi:flagellar basal body-associated FliL family protein [Pseudomonadales bacterium]|nr:flagellar basal body-associated FliL family protein [Pseudomonadales bacterium]